MARKDRSYIGKGPVYIRERSSAGGFFPMGNSSVLSISFDEEEKSLKDYTNEGGGNINTLTSITGMTGTITVHDFSAFNFALFLRGIEGSESAGAVTDEAHATQGVEGEFIPFNHLVNKGAPGITVTLTDATPCVEGTDYAVENNGIIVIGTGNIDGNGILVDYTKDDFETLQALTASGSEFEMYLNAVNEAQGGVLSTVRLHRLKFSPAQDIGFIGDEFGEMTADFEVLSDGNIVGAGLSKFMVVQQVVPA